VDLPPLIDRYSSGDMNGSYIIDNVLLHDVGFGDVIIQETTLGVVDTGDSGAMGGILGVGWEPNYSNLVNDMYLAGWIKSRTFSIYLDSLKNTGECFLKLSITPLTLK
jgi:hypothetical protein